MLEVWNIPTRSSGLKYWKIYLWCTQIQKVYQKIEKKIRIIKYVFVNVTTESKIEFNFPYFQKEVSKGRKQ